MEGEGGRLPGSSAVSAGRLLAGVSAGAAPTHFPGPGQALPLGKPACVQLQGCGVSPSEGGAMRVLRPCGDGKRGNGLWKYSACFVCSISGQTRYR